LRDRRWPSEYIGASARDAASRPPGREEGGETMAKGTSMKKEKKKPKKKK